MSGWGQFNSQFRETEWEQQKRQAERRKWRTDNGFCWQCADRVQNCKCLNVTHTQLDHKTHEGL